MKAPLTGSSSVLLLMALSASSTGARGNGRAIQCDKRAALEELLSKRINHIVHKHARRDLRSSTRGRYGIDFCADHLPVPKHPDQRARRELCPASPDPGGHNT